jgi:hypothetical protein
MTDEHEGKPSASKQRRYELCPGSWQLEQEARRLGQVAHEDSPAARRGTLIHAFLAGQPDEDGREIVLTDQERITADFLQERSQEQITRIFGDQPYQELNEKRLWLTLNGEKVLSGRFDKILYTSTTALLIDWKTGFSEPVEAEQNSQLKVLSVLVALHMPPTLKEVVAMIVSGPFGVTEARYDRVALKDAWDSIVRTLQAIQNPRAPIVPSVEACKHCPAAMICQPSCDLLGPPTKFQTTTLPLEPERAAKLLDEIAILENAFDEVKLFYYDRLAGDPTAKISGYELVPNAPRREIEDVETARKRLAEFLEEGELNAALDLKVGAVEKLFGKRVGLRGKELREKFNAVLAGVIIEKTPNPSLKRVSGKGRAVVELP